MMDIVKPKSQPITDAMVMDAYKSVNKSSKGKGIDEQSYTDFDKDKSKNLYKIWNRMSSGSYFPPPVKEVEIPKPNSTKTRKLGITTVSDRIAQKVVSNHLDKIVDIKFDKSSYAYRKDKSAQEALQKCKKNCWRYYWVLDMDIKGFFDNIDRDLLMEILLEHTQERWVLMYVERWLNAPYIQKDGTLVHRDKGTPQGGVISPVLANMFLDVVFDKWFRKHFPNLEFERYADDIIVHSYSEAQANYILDKAIQRFSDYKLELHPDKTKVVHCKQGKHKGIKYPNNSFKFLGIQFRPLKHKNKQGEIFLGFSSVVPMSSTVKLGDFVRGLKLQRKTKHDIYQISELINERVGGWINYFKRWGMRENCDYFFYKLNERLAKWAMNRYKRFNMSKKRAYGLLKQIQKHNPSLFTHWKHGFRIGSL